MTTLGQMLQDPELRAVRRASGCTNPPARVEGADDIDHRPMQAWVQEIDGVPIEHGFWALSPETRATLRVWRADQR